MFTTSSNNSEKRWTEWEGREDPSASAAAALMKSCCVWAAGRVSQPYFMFQVSCIGVYTDISTAACDTEHAVHVSSCPQVPRDRFRGSIIDGADEHLMDPRAPDRSLQNDTNVINNVATKFLHMEHPFIQVWHFSPYFLAENRNSQAQGARTCTSASVYSFVWLCTRRH